MPHVPKRPPALAHLSDEAASIVLSRHFGDMVAAAKELGVDRKDLRRLTWNNPKILAAAHERMALFRIGVRSKIIGAIYSKSAARRRWGSDFPCATSTATSFVIIRLPALGCWRGRAQRLLIRTEVDLSWNARPRLSVSGSKPPSLMPTCRRGARESARPSSRRSSVRHRFGLRVCGRRSEDGQVGAGGARLRPVSVR